MKKLIPFLLIIILLFSSCQQINTQPENKNPEMHGIWISCYDHISAEGKTEEEYKSETDKMFRNIADFGLNTAFIHMRAFSDSFYKSDIFPYSSYIAGTQGNKLAFDPFEIMLKSAEENGISVHGWINPFRVSTNPDPALLHKDNPAKKILESGNPDREIVVLQNGIYYNPSCTSNHKLVIDGVREILENYNICGIHIDDYFYPSTDEAVDSIQYKQYIQSGGTLPLNEWRTANVNAFVSGLYNTVKSYGDEIIFSISPSADSEKNKNELYANCELWLKEKGYADLIIPQIYFGFEHTKFAFTDLMNKWSSFEKNPDVDLACGIAAYKCSLEDEYAGSGSNEWLNQNDILARQVSAIQNSSDYSGFVIFSYSDLERGTASEEFDNLRKILITENR